MTYDSPDQYDKVVEIKTDSALGYQYFIDKEHPLASNNVGRVWYHRHIASIKLGRWLENEEVVHHIDENRSNNTIDNLSVFGSTSEHAKHHSNYVPPVNCKQCKKLFQPDNNKGRTYCSQSCSRAAQRKTNITKEQLESLVWEMPLEQIASKFGVSGRAVGKWCKKWNIKKPPHGYWIKKRP